jgi:hypothetical protein
MPAAQVLKFVMVQFDQNWTRAAGAEDQIIYTATPNQAKVAVVRESPNSVATTYLYAVAAGQSCWIVLDVIHVPEGCIAQEPGNTIRCG